MGEYARNCGANNTLSVCVCALCVYDRCLYVCVCIYMVCMCDLCVYAELYVCMECFKVLCVTERGGAGERGGGKQAVVKRSRQLC